MTDKELDRKRRPPPGDHPPRRGIDRERCADLPLLRDQPNGVLHVAAPVPGRRVSRAARPVETAAAQPRHVRARPRCRRRRAARPQLLGQPLRLDHPASRHQQQRQQRPPPRPAQPQHPAIPDRLHRPQDAEVNHRTHAPTARRPRTHHRRPPVPALATGTDGEADALTPASKTQKASPKCIRPSTRKRSGHNRLAYLRPDHARPLFRRKTWPIAARRFLMHRKIAERSYATDQKAESATDTAAADYPRSDAVRRPCIQPGERTDDRG